MKTTPLGISICLDKLQAVREELNYCTAHEYEKLKKREATLLGMIERTQANIDKRAKGVN